MVLKSFYQYLFVDIIKFRKDANFFHKSMHFNECYKRSVIEKNLPVQFAFYSIHLILFLLLIEKVYTYSSNLDELEVIIFFDEINMIEMNPNLNLILISLILNSHYTYHTFYIAIDDYYTFNLNAVLNDNCKALFGSDYVYHGDLATKHIRIQMLKILDLFYISDLITGESIFQLQLKHYFF